MRAFDRNNVDIFKGRELFLDDPDRLFTTDADALSFIECHGLMLGSDGLQSHPPNGKRSVQGNRQWGTIVIPTCAKNTLPR